MKLLFSRKTDGQCRWIFWRWLDIYGRNAAPGAIYMRRLYVFRCPLFSMMVNRIKMRDPDAHDHDHPWSFISFIIRGSYIERRRGRVRAVRWFNACRVGAAHSIVEVSDNCTTILINGRRKARWGFHTPDGWVYWREYLGMTKAGD